VGPEKAGPGSDGATPWNASASSPPWHAGSRSGSTTSRNSTIEPGQPWVSTSGRAVGTGDGACRQWMRSPSISVVTWSQPLSLASFARQSYPSCQ